MEESIVLSNSSSNAVGNTTRIAKQMLFSEQQHSSSIPGRPKATFMSPTDNFFSPCSKKLSSRKGSRHFRMPAVTPHQLAKGHAFQNTTCSNEDSKENQAQQMN